MLTVEPVVDELCSVGSRYVTRLVSRRCIVSVVHGARESVGTVCN